MRVPAVRVVAEDGQQVGILPVAEALRMAEERALDLVEVAPQATPPVCRIMDYGKFRYQQSKRAQQARQRQRQIHVKEIKIRPKTDSHDLEFKMNHVRRFLEEGNKAKVTMMFRGRELAHPDLAEARLRQVAASLSEVGVVESQPALDGRTMSMIIAPSPKALRQREQRETAPAGGRDGKQAEE